MSIPVNVNQETTLVVPNDPSPQAQLRLRHAHFKHAVDLFGMLTSVMDSTVSNRRNITHSTDPDVKVSGDGHEIHKIEVAIEHKFQVIHAARNEAMAFCHRLPDDLLMHVFQIPFEEEWSNRIHWSITMSHVCTKWRRIAIRTAALWAMVCYTSKPSRPPHVPTVERRRYEVGRSRQKEWTDWQRLTFLLRSRGAGLASELKCNTDSQPATDRFLEFCAPRTDDMTFTFQQTCSHPRTMDTIMPCMAVVSRQLRRLKISFPSFTEYDMGNHMAPLFNTVMPALREVVFHNVPLTRLDGQYPMLWTCQKLDIVASPQAFFTSDVLVPLLKSAQELRELCIDISTSWLMQPTNITSERVVMPHLVKYVVATGAWMERAFEFFAAPKLQWMEMDTERCEIPSYTYDAPIYEFLNVSRPPIETFIVRHVTHSVLHLLRLLPTIRSIAFLSAEADYGAAYMQVLDGMTESIVNPGSYSGICPDLESWCTDLALDEEHLTKLYNFSWARKHHNWKLTRIMFKRTFHWDMKFPSPASSTSAGSPRSDESGSQLASSVPDDTPEPFYDENILPEVWLDYLEPEPVRGDKLLAAQVKQFIMGDRIYDSQTDHWEFDGIVRPEERFFEDHMTKRDGFVAG